MCSNTHREQQSLSDAVSGEIIDKFWDSVESVTYNVNHHDMFPTIASRRLYWAKKKKTAGTVSARPFGKRVTSKPKAVLAPLSRRWQHKHQINGEDKPKSKNKEDGARTGSRKRPSSVQILSVHSRMKRSGIDGRKKSKMLTLGKTRVWNVSRRKKWVESRRHLSNISAIVITSSSSLGTFVFRSTAPKCKSVSLETLRSSSQVDVQLDSFPDFCTSSHAFAMQLRFGCALLSLLSFVRDCPSAQVSVSPT